MTRRPSRSGFCRPSEDCDIPSHAFCTLYDRRFTPFGGGRRRALCRTGARAILALRFAPRGFLVNETQGGQVGAQAVAAAAPEIFPAANRQASRRRSSQSVAPAIARGRHAACRGG